MLYRVAKCEISAEKITGANFCKTTSIQDMIGPPITHTHPYVGIRPIKSSTLVSLFVHVTVFVITFLLVFPTAVLFTSSSIIMGPFVSLTFCASHPDKQSIYFVSLCLFTPSGVLFERCFLRFKPCNPKSSPKLP